MAKHIRHTFQKIREKIVIAFPQNKGTKITICCFAQRQKTCAAFGLNRQERPAQILLCTKSSRSLGKGRKLFRYGKAIYAAFRFVTQDHAVSNIKRQRTAGKPMQCP